MMMMTARKWGGVEEKGGELAIRSERVKKELGGSALECKRKLRVRACARGKESVSDRLESKRRQLESQCQRERVCDYCAAETELNENKLIKTREHRAQYLKKRRVKER